MDVSEKTSVYEFSGFRLDAAHRRLLSPAGAPIPLTSRVFDTLIYLVEHQGELVDKATLMQAVWPGAVVEENNLNQAVAALRKALGEKRGEHRFIVTDPGRGYRFVGDVKVPDDESSREVTDQDMEPVSGSDTRRRTIAIIGLVVIGLVLGGGYLYSRLQGAAPAGKKTVLVTPAPIPHSIAVLPFDNLSPNPEDAYFAAGIHDEILNRLAGIKGLNVIARTSVLQYAGAARPITEIARELRVETVMEGTVRYANRRVRITAQLVDGRKGTELWSRTYSRDLEDVFAIQSEIATTIAAALETEPLPAELARLEKPLTDSPAAYALFLQATDLLNSGKQAESIAVLDRVIVLDPKFAMAYALKAYQGTWTLVNSTVPAPHDPTTQHELERRALEDADRALELDPNLGVAWLARAVIDTLSWRWNKADEAFARALELSPNDVNVLRDYAWFKWSKGEDDEAMRLARRQLALSPNDLLSYAYLLWGAFFTGRLEEALPVAQNGVERFPASPIMVSMLGYTYMATGNFAAAESYLRTAEQLMTDETDQFRMGLVTAYSALGHPEDAMRVFKQVQTWSRTHGVGAGDWAAMYLGIGQPDTAYEWLARAVERAERHEIDAGHGALIVIKKNLGKDPVLEQPRFRALRERLDAAAMSD
jgi:TolB-like protein/DNA-binding winged helix-turn-helix (wHTH) protein/Tfp pilus assembly protein PilF